MALRSGNGLVGYRSLASCLIWILAACFLFVLWFRYSGPVAEQQDASFLSSIWARTSSNPFYQLFLAAGMGTIGYAFSVLLAFSHGPLAKSGRVLAGLPKHLLDTAEDRGQFHTVGQNIALAPIRDGAAIFPGLGFLGTVIGVSIAISGLDAVVETGDTAELMTGLRSAFDTTFFGLTVSVILSIFASVIQVQTSRLGAFNPEPLAPEES